MINKKAQFFAIYLVLVTLFMCSLVVFIYVTQNRTISSSLVSPIPVLKLQDNWGLFEKQENATALISAKNTLATNSWNTDKFIDDFKIKFFEYINSDNQIALRQFLSSDLKDYKAGDNVDIKIYYSFSFDNNKLKVERKSFTKFLFLKAKIEDSNVQRFPVRVEYIVPARTYLFDKEEIK